MAVSTVRRRAHVALPDELLKQIDERVGQRKRSEFIQEAIEDKLSVLRRAERFKQVVGSIGNGDIPEWDTPEMAAAWVRKIRKDSDASLRAMNRLPELG